MTTALAVVGLAVSITEFGTNEYLVRELAWERAEANTLVTSLLVGRIGLGLLAAALLPLTVLVGQTDAEVAALVAAALYTISFRLGEFLRGCYRAFEVLKYEAISLSVERVLAIGTGLVGLLATRTAWGALVGLAAGAAISVILNWLWVRRRIARVGRRAFRWDVLRRGYIAAIPLGVLSLSSGALNVVPFPVLEATLGNAAVGRYGVAYKAIEMLQLFPAIVAAPLMPRLARLYATSDATGYRRMLLRGGGLVLFGTTFLGITLALLAPFVVNLLAPGDGFNGTAALLRGLALVYPIMALGLIVTSAHVAQNQHGLAAAVTAGGAVVCLTTMLLLVPFLGTMAGPVALGVSHSLVLVCLLVAFWLRAPAPPPPATTGPTR